MRSPEHAPAWSQHKHDWIESAYRRLQDTGQEIPFPRSATARLLRDIHHAHHVIAGSHSEFLKPYNLTEAKFRLLMWLLMAERLGHPNGMLPSQLSEFQGISRNTVSALLKALLSQDLIVRTHHPDDRRQYMISISDSGRTLLSKVGEDYLAFVELSLNTLSDEERGQLSTLLEKLSQSIISSRRLAHPDQPAAASMSPFCSAPPRSDQPDDPDDV